MIRKVLRSDRPIARNRTEPVSLFVAMQPAQAAARDLWVVALPDNTTLLWLAFGLLGAIILGGVLYRLTVKSQMSKGVHPHHLGLSLLLLCAGCFLVYGYFFLSETVLGAGYFAVIGGIYLFLILVLLMMGRVTRWILYFLLSVLLLAGFRYLSILS
ncbi:MAG: hypothetical protein ACRER2_18460 [Methylococcales bacterium]